MVAFVLDVCHILVDFQKKKFFQFCRPFYFMVLFYEMAISNVRKLDTLNHAALYNLALTIFKVFVLIWLDVDLSLNQTRLISLSYVRQTWKTQLILAISL